MIAIKSSHGIQTVPITALLMQKRIVYLSGDITHDAAVEFSQQVIYFNFDDETVPIKVFIDSPGGEIAAGMAIYDVVQGSRAPIQFYCVGRAYSMAAVLLASGRHGRYLLPHSRVMIHEPLIPYGVGGKSSSVQTISEALLKTKQQMEALLAKHTGRTEAEIAENTKTDRFFDADEAVAFGLVDGVKRFDEMMA